MGALRVNLTDGTSTYIDLTDAILVRSIDNNQQSFKIEVNKNTGSIIYNVTRFNSSPGTSSEGVTWAIAMDVAYTKISIDPIRYGYPDLGSDPQTYIAYDDEKFLAAAIASALNNSQEPAVLTNRTAISSGVSSTSDGKDLNSIIQDLWTEAQSEAAATLADCLAVTDDGSTFDGGGCSCPSLTPGVSGAGGANEACCKACSDAILTAQKDVIAAIGGDIIWKHQYLFDQVQAEI